MEQGKQDDLMKELECRKRQENGCMRTLYKNKYKFVSIKMRILVCSLYIKSVSRRDVGSNECENKQDFVQPKTDGKPMNMEEIVVDQNELRENNKSMRKALG